MLLRLWKFVWEVKNREILSWLGGGAVVIVAGAWTLFTYFHDDKKLGALTTTVVNPSGSNIIAPGGVFNGPVNLGPDQKRIDDKIDEVKVLVQQLLAVSQAQAAPGREQAVSTAVENITKGAAAGEAPLQQALDLLKEHKVEDASRVLRAFADDKTTQLAQDQARLKADSLDAAAAYRNLGAIAGLADPKSAREAYGRAVALDPDDREALYWHGWLQLRAGDLGSADRDLNRLLQVAAAAHDDRGTYRAYLRLGEIFQVRGNLQSAREYEDRAYDLAKRNAEQSPDDQEWQRDLAVSYNKIGAVLGDQGNLPEALKSYQDGFAITDRLAKADPSNAERERDLIVSYERIGDVLRAQGNLLETLKSYGDQFVIADRLAKADPGNAEWQRNLSISYEKIGDVLKAQGNLPAALESYRHCIPIRDRLAKADPDNAELQRDLSISFEKIADVLKEQGNLPEALESYRRCIPIKDRLAKADPDNPRFQRNLAVFYSKLGYTFKEAGEKSEALEALRQGRAVMIRVTSLSPNNAEWQRDLEWFDQQIAELAK
jgi:tetratricopeptide (TPR) repeat protein